MATPDFESTEEGRLLLDETYTGIVLLCTKLFIISLKAELELLKNEVSEQTRRVVTYTPCFSHDSKSGIITKKLTRKEIVYNRNSLNTSHSFRVYTSYFLVSK